jgi:ribosomal protein S18 acetylase RimI-like enzyme
MDLADRGHAAMAERFQLGTEADGGEVLETRDGLLYAMRTGFPVMMNGAIPYAGGDPRALVAAARDWFAERRRGFTVFARTAAEDEAAADGGMQVILEHYPALVLRAPVPDPKVPEGLTLRRVEDEDAVREYLAVADASFTAIGMPAGVLAALAPAAFLGPETRAFVAYEGSRPLAVASVVLAQGIGGIQWVGVLEEARGRGLARLVTAVAANAAFSDLGAECAWLEASHMGEPVYLRMGFEEVFSYRVYLAPPPAEA